MDKSTTILPPVDIKSINTNTNVKVNLSKLENDIFTQYADVFTNTIGTIPNIKGKLKLREGVSPIYIKPRPVPYAIRHLIEDEIEKLEKSGTLEKVEHSDWGTPIVPILKSENEIRLCADYKVTLNRTIFEDKYPIPRIEDMMRNFDNSEYYCVFDVHKAYLHMAMDEESSLLQTISTHKGLYKVRKLMFGVKTAPNIWQRFMDENITNDLTGTQCFFDDIIVAGRTLPETIQRVHALLNKLRKFNLHLNKNKCKLFRESVTYLGYTISKAGLQKNADKTKAIANIQRPKDVTELRQFIGMVTFYNNFIPNMAARLNPLYNLLHDDVQFEWDKKCQQSFEDIKAELQSDKVLMPYDEKLPLILATDASPFGISAILSHKTSVGERPIAYASRTLSKSESNYSQLHKEATAIYWALFKFFSYCYGRDFTLITDNKPLSLIFSPDKSFPVLTAQRLLGYAQFLSGFKYKIEHRSAKDHMNVDFLSRHPVVDTNQPCDKEEVAVNQLTEFLPITHGTISKALRRDNTLCDLYNRLQTGGSLDGTPFKGQDAELMIQDGCIFKGIRIIIPVELRKLMLDELHTAHIGIVKMKALARSYCYWIGMDHDIEVMVKSCRDCARVAKEPAKAPIHTWDLPAMPWQRIHVDFAGPFMENYFMVVVDARTKWLEVVPMKSITSYFTIRSLREIFARFGIPSVVVIDNGSNFTSGEFQDFLKSNGITHKRTAPAHASTNGQAERSVQSLKFSLRSAINDSGDLHVKLQRFLMQYRKLPNESTGKSPAEQMLKFNLRSRIDLIKPMDKVINYNNNNQSIRSIREYRSGDRVQIRHYQNKMCKWKFGKIIEKVGLLHYLIDIDGQVQRRHIDQIRSTLVEGNTDGYHVLIPVGTENPVPMIDAAGGDNNPEIIEQQNDDLTSMTTNQTPNVLHETTASSSNDLNQQTIDTTSCNTSSSNCKKKVTPSSTVVRRSSRIRRPPSKLNL